MNDVWLVFSDDEYEGCFTDESSAKLYIETFGKHHSMFAFRTAPWKFTQSEVDKFNAIV